MTRKEYNETIGAAARENRHDVITCWICIVPCIVGLILAAIKLF